MSRILNWTLRHVRIRRTHPKLHPTGDADGGSISSLSNELVLAILALLDAASLHRMAAVSRRYYELATYTLLFHHGITLSAGRPSVSCQTSAALRALRLSMALPQGPFLLGSFDYIETTHPKTTDKDVRRLTALLKSLNGGHEQWIHFISLNFGGDILTGPAASTMANLAPKLLRALCGDSRYAVVFVGDGVFTCQAKTFLRSWSPYMRAPHTQINLHDGTSQVAPTIRSITTLHATYPAISGEPWTRVVVDETRITTLVLSIKLQSAEWAVVFADVTFPNLESVEIRRNTGIHPSLINEFIDRHSLKRIVFMSSNSNTGPGEGWRLNQPKLEQLTALAHDVDYVLPSDASQNTTLNALTHVDLHPDDHLRAALTKLSLHTPLTNLTLSFFETEHFPSAAWPVFPTISTLTLFSLGLEPTPTTAERLSAVLAQSFPALRKLEISFVPGMAAPTNYLDAYSAASGSKWRVDGPSEVLSGREFSSALARARERQSTGGGDAKSRIVVSC
ncbi:hypothetical protein C8F01DRAFT_1288380 [Mycena amicta]|nr:hypothetical protein C8F01DRAFT_1288380 [Mycena amicta]